MHDEIAKMRNELPTYLGNAYAEHLMIVTRWSSILKKSAVRASLRDYFKAKDDQYWESLYMYCRNKKIPWVPGYLCLKLMKAFDKALDNRMNDVRLLNKAFVSSRELAAAFGKPYVAEKSEVEDRPYVAGSRPVSLRAASSCRRGPLPSEAGFWEDWDYE